MCCRLKLGVAPGKARTAGQCSGSPDTNRNEWGRSTPRLSARLSDNPSGSELQGPTEHLVGGGGLQSPNLGSPVQHGEDADETPQQRHKIVQLPLAVSIAFLSLRTHLHEPSSFTVTPAHQELSVPPSGSSLPWPGSQLWMSQAKIKVTARLASHGGLRGKLHSQAHSRGQNYIAS